MITRNQCEIIAAMILGGLGIIAIIVGYTLGVAAVFALALSYAFGVTVSKGVAFAVGAVVAAITIYVKVAG